MTTGLFIGLLGAEVGAFVLSAGIAYALTRRKIRKEKDKHWYGKEDA